MMKGQLDKTMVAMPGKALHNVAGKVKDGVKMKGQMDKMSPSSSMTGMTKSKVAMKGQLD